MFPFRSAVLRYVRANGWLSASTASCTFPALSLSTRRYSPAGRRDSTLSHEFIPKPVNVCDAAGAAFLTVSP